MRVLLFFFTFIFNLGSQAEYRAFMLHLVNDKKKTSKQILTTLDPDQYKTQFPLNPDEKLTYESTWKCLGRTDFFQPICDKPDKNLERKPSQSLDSNKNK